MCVYVCLEVDLAGLAWLSVEMYSGLHQWLQFFKFFLSDFL